MRNHIIGCRIVFRDGPDDFTTWEVDIPTNVMSAAMEGHLLCSGNINAVVDAIPITTECPETELLFLFQYNDDAYALYRSTVSDTFLEDNRHRGCSERGPKLAVFNL